MDTRQFNLCELEWAYNEGAEGEMIGHACATPQVIWSKITGPEVERRGSGGTEDTVQKGLLFANPRWKYRYSCRANMSLSSINTLTTNWTIRIMSALVISPTDSGGAPLVDGVTASLPVLFGDANQVEYPQGIIVLWRGMDFVSPTFADLSAAGPAPQLNVADRYIPLERSRCRVKLNEGRGIFWVREFLNTDNDFSVSTVIKENLSMTYKLGNLK